MGDFVGMDIEARGERVRRPYAVDTGIAMSSEACPTDVLESVWMVQFGMAGERIGFCG